MSGCKDELVKRNDDIIRKIYHGIDQVFVFNEFECETIENYVENVVSIAENGGYKQYTVDEMPLRKKYFFGEGYTYGSQMSKRGPGMERIYPHGYIEPIPSWVTHHVIKPLVLAKIISKDFINSVVINVYQPGGCIVSHIDPPHIFDRPIVSLSLFSDSALSFGCKFDFKPIRCTKPIVRLPLPRGVVTLISGYAANEVTHCVRPEDTKYRRAVIILRRVLPEAPRMSPDDPFLKQTQTPRYSGHISNICSLFSEHWQDYIQVEHNLVTYLKECGKCVDCPDQSKSYTKVSQIKRTQFKRRPKLNTFKGEPLNEKIFYEDNYRYMNEPFKLSEF